MTNDSVNLPTYEYIRIGLHNDEVVVGTNEKDMGLCIDMLLEAVFILAGAYGASLNLTEEDTKELIDTQYSAILARPLGTRIDLKDWPHDNSEDSVSSQEERKNGEKPTPKNQKPPTPAGDSP